MDYIDASNKAQASQTHFQVAYETPQLDLSVFTDIEIEFSQLDFIFKGALREVKANVFYRMQQAAAMLDAGTARRNIEYLKTESAYNAFISNCEAASVVQVNAIADLGFDLLVEFLDSEQQCSVFKMQAKLLLKGALEKLSMPIASAKARKEDSKKHEEDTLKGMTKLIP